MPQQTAVGPHKNIVKTIDYKCNIMNASMQRKKAEKEKSIQILRLNDNHDNQEYSIKVNYIYIYIETEGVKHSKRVKTSLSLKFWVKLRFLGPS